MEKVKEKEKEKEKERESERDYYGHNGPPKKSFGERSGLRWRSSFSDLHPVCTPPRLLSRLQDTYIAFT